MRSVAKACGLSISSVSLALRNHPSIPLPTRQRILSAVREVGYRPNPMVTALMSQLRPLRVAAEPLPLMLLNNWPESDRRRLDQRSVYQRFCTGAKNRAGDLGFRLEEFWIADPQMTPARIHRTLTTRSIRGLILPPSPLGRLPIRWDHFSCAALGHSELETPIHRVHHDQFSGMCIALQNLECLGYRRVGLHLSPEGDRRTEGRWIGAYHLHHFNRSKQMEWIKPRIENYSERGMLAWLRREKPQAVLVENHQSREFLLGLAASGGPAVAYLDVPQADSTLAGVLQPWEECGSVCVDMVVAQFHRNEYGLPRIPKVIQLPGRWVDGTSCPPRAPTA